MPQLFSAGTPAVQFWSAPFFRGAALLLLACFGVRCTVTTDSELSVSGGGGTPGSGGAGVEQIQANFSYRSSSIDVDATLITHHSPEGCFSSGRLLIDKFASRADRYVLDDVPCAELELATSGDILFYGSPSGHDWTKEALHVDTSREIISLGPWSPEGAVGGSTTIELSAPSCGGSCDCARMVRRSGEETLMIELARRCD